MHLAGVHHRAQPHPQLGLGDGGVVLGQQGGQGRDQPADQDGLRHIIVWPDQDQHPVAAIGQLFQMPGTDPGGLERLLQQVVQDAAEFALGRIGALGGAFDVDRDDRAVHRAAAHRGHHRQLAHRSSSRPDRPSGSFLSMTRQADDYPLVSKPGLPWTALPGPRPPRVRLYVGPHSGGRACMARPRAPSRGHVLRLCTAFDKLGRL